MIHFLGGSAKSWKGVTAALPPSIRAVTIDLPGFGGAAQLPGYTVAEMATAVVERIRAERPRRWILVGHSMGAKIAMAVARRAEDGEAGLEGLASMVLLAGSPPGPEPMDEDRRTMMAGWFAGDAAQSWAEAAQYIDANSGSPIHSDMRRQAVADVLRAARPAWLAWLNEGSREDWQAKIGMLQTPALIVAGGGDADLGFNAQRQLTAPHFTRHRLQVLEGAKHLLPLERPEQVAARIAAAVAGAVGPEISPAYRALIDSDRVSTVTRAALLDRARPDPLLFQPRVLNARQLDVLRAVLARILPQTGAPIDLAARLDTMLDEKTGDGWRITTQPPDAEAYRAGLDALDGVGQPFDALASQDQDALLRNVQAGQGPRGRMTPTQMATWFTDLCADATRLFVAHPATLGRLGFSGIGYGGNAACLPGFKEIGIGAREAWEPEAER
jgi:pimeloyl-ACP methyl ester carboxylesterase